MNVRAIALFVIPAVLTLSLVALSPSGADKVVPRPESSAGHLDADGINQLLLDHLAGELQVKRVRRGWKLRGIQAGSAAVGVGLLDGDVVLGIGGIPLTDGASLRAAYQDFRKHGRTVIAIERAGTPLELTVTYAPPPPPDYSAVVRQLDERTWEVSRARLEVILADPGTLTRQARVVPSIKDGVPNGIKVYALRPGSLYQALGIENGDTLHQVNDHAIGASDKHFLVFNELRERDTWTLVLSRRGQERVHTYRMIP